MYWTAALLAACIALLFLPLRLGFSFHYEDNRGDVRFIVAFARSLHFHIRIPLQRTRLQPSEVSVPAQAGLTAATQSRLHVVLTVVDFTHLLLTGRLSKRGRYRSLGNLMLHLFTRPAVAFGKYLCRLEFSWETRLGTGDAVSTALGVGILWSLISSVGALMQKRFTVLVPPRLSVTPDFDQAVFVTDIRCIFHLSIGQIMWRTVRDAAQRWQRKGVEAVGG